MNKSIPSLSEIRGCLAGLNHVGLHALAERSDTPFPTLMKIRQGTIKNPGIETVRKFLPMLGKAKRSVKQDSTPDAAQ